MTIIIQHDPPPVTTLNPYKVQEDFAAQQAAEQARQAKQRQSAEDIQKDIAAGQAGLQGHTDKLNQRETELANRERALKARMETFSKEKPDLEKRWQSELDKLNQREAALADREKAVRSQTASYEKERADLEKRLAALESKYKHTIEAEEGIKAKLRELVR